jgi:hypothetical protein
MRKCPVSDDTTRPGQLYIQVNASVDLPKAMETVAPTYSENQPFWTTPRPGSQHQGTAQSWNRAHEQDLPAIDGHHGIPTPEAASHPVNEDAPDAPNGPEIVGFLDPMPIPSLLARGEADEEENLHPWRPTDLRNWDETVDPEDLQRPPPSPTQQDPVSPADSVLLQMMDPRTAIQGWMSTLLEAHARQAAEKEEEKKKKEDEKKEGEEKEDEKENSDHENDSDFVFLDWAGEQDGFVLVEEDMLLVLKL